MQKIIVTLALLFLALMTAIVLSTEHPQPLNELYVFGDSLSDTGAVFRATGGAYPPNPPYFQGRYSNGRVWVEYLADRLQIQPSHIHNFACGGATTGSDRNSLVPGLVNQVQSWIQSHPNQNTNALYVLWAGANDYLQGVTRTAEPIDNVIRSMSALTNRGAEKFLVANLPDLGRLPASQNSANSSTLSILAQQHNQNLRRSLKQLHQQHPQLQIAMLDANTLYKEAIAQPSNFGFTNVTSHCLVGSQPCQSPHQFLFWDSIHPTTVAHRHLGETAFLALQEAGLIQAKPAPGIPQ